MTAVFRATTVVNFGHGDLLMAGAFVVHTNVVNGSTNWISYNVLTNAVVTIKVTEGRLAAINVKGSENFSANFEATATGAQLSHSYWPPAWT